MAKRKRTLTLQRSPRKRARGGLQASTQHPHGNFDPDLEYKLKSIVGESKTHYLISWEDDEETGQQFEASWEPKANANREAIADWERQQADKKRIERRIGQGGSRSTSNTPKPTTPKKPPVTLRLKGRPRKVVESSPPPTETPHTNGDREPYPAIDDLLEIDESQPSQSTPQLGAAVTYSGIVSPLFVPAKSPSATEVPDQSLTAVLSEPPSSYYAGAYEPVSSPQRTPSTHPPANDSPEPSQYVPDPADTSKTTEDTTGSSLALTTPSQQTRSVPVNFGQSSTTKIVPDSQSLVGSSSYVPSATTTEHSSASGIQVRSGLEQAQSSPSTREPGEREASLRAEVADQPASRSHDPEQLIEGGVGVQTEELTSSANHTTPQRKEARTSDQGGEGLAGDRTHPELSVDAAEPAERAEESQNPSQGDQVVPVDETEEPSSRASDQPHKDGQGVQSTIEGAAVHRYPSPSPVHIPPDSEHQTEKPQAESPKSTIASREPTAETTTALEPTSAQPHISQRGSPDSSSASTTHKPEDRRTAEHLDSSTQSGTPHPQKSQEVDQAARDRSVGRSQDEPLSTQDQLPSRPESQEPARSTEHVDLTATTQDHSTSTSRFSVTPPPPDTLLSAQRYPKPQPPSSSTLFPFLTQIFGRGATFTQTQVSRPQTSGPTLPSSALGTSDLQSQPFSLSHTQQREFTAITERAQSAPLGQYSPVPTSSSIPLPPSQSIGLGVLGETAPPIPKTLSSPLRAPSVASNMDAAQSRGGNLRERLREMRQKPRRELAMLRGETPTSAPSGSAVDGLENVQPQSSIEPSVPPATAPSPPHVLSQAPMPVSTGAKTPPTVLARLASPFLAQDGARSPSAVPHLEPLPIITQEEMNTAERYETLLPQALERGTSNRQANGFLTAAETTPDQRNGIEDPETANLYTVPISMGGQQRDHYPEVVFFYRDAIHRFLNTDNPDAELVAKNKEFVTRMRCITMHPDLDNQETLTQYDVDPSQIADWHVNCSAKFRFLKELFNQLRDENLHIVIVASPGRIGDILDTFLQGIKVAYKRPHLHSLAEASGDGVIRATLLDTDAETNKADPADIVIAMDNFVRHDSQYIRALRQRGSKWAPFISLVVPCTVEHVERCLSPNLSDRANSRALVSGIFQYRADAGRLEEGQQAPKEAAFALAHYLKNIDKNVEWPLAPLSALHDLGSQTESEIEPTIGDEGPTRIPHVGEKRSHEPDDEADPNKRIRVEPVAHHEEAEITHISDSVDKTTQSNDTRAEVGDSSPLLSTNEKRLQELLFEKQNSLEEHVQALSDLQYRYEEQRNQLIEVTNARDSAVTMTQQAVNRFTEQSNNQSHARMRLRELEDQVKDLNERLANHAIPERAEFEKVRLEVEQTNIEKAKTDQRLQQAQKDLEYVRGLYQESSTQAQQFATQTTELENQLAVAQNKATGEHAKLRQMGYDTFTKTLRDENKKLKTLLENREASLKFRDEEIAKLKEASRGRMGTRGTSVPRSPRIGSPRMGSRQASPAAGELRGRSALLHPLRNA